MSYDTDAAAYITAVETADAAALPTHIKNAIDAFVVGCKADGIWTPIKAACFLAGPATLVGALTPLVGSAPTNVSGLFVSGDYNQLTGLKGNGSAKYLDTNYAYASGLQNNKHGAVWASEPQTTGISGGAAYFGSSDSSLGAARSQLFIPEALPLRVNTRLSDETSTQSTGTRNTAGLIGISRAVSGSYTQRGNGGNETVSVSSLSGAEGNMFVFRRNNLFSALATTARMAFYSFGESLDLALLDARLAAYMAAIATPTIFPRRRRSRSGGGVL
jgi:hypothetical protein